MGAYGGPRRGCQPALSRDPLMRSTVDVHTPGSRPHLGPSVGIRSDESSGDRRGEHLYGFPLLAEAGGWYRGKGPLYETPPSSTDLIFTQSATRSTGHILVREDPLRQRNPS